MCCYVFFFKQKMAYGVRLIDWRSAVCSSDLVEPYPIAARNAGGRSPAPDGMQRQPLQQFAILVRLGLMDLEIGDERTRVRCGHARQQTQFQGCRTCGGEDFALTSSLDEDHGRRRESSKRGVRKGDTSRRGHM